MKKEKATTRSKENYKMKELTRKHKHIAKVRNHLYTKLVGKLKDASSKMIYIHNEQ